MSRIAAVTFASLLALAASPAAAQYGGSPDQQIDPPAAYAGPIAGKGSDQDQDAGPAAYAGKGDDQAGDSGPGAYDKDQGDEQGVAPPPPPPPGPDEGYGPGQCRRSDGTTGAIVGGGAGALIGHGIDRHGERGTGTIIGAVLGALVGHAVEQGAACR